jgi:hypothetical protein
LEAYLKRVNAEQLNFRRFMVKKEVAGGDYYMERSLITIKDVDGKRELTWVRGDDRDKFTDAEKSLIDAEIADWPAFPTSIETTVAAAEIFRRKRGIEKDKWFVFLNAKRDGVIMCQERVDEKNRTKYYVPWSYFSDAEWRRMEPGRGLPFWKPQQRIEVRLMIHEGAKAARHVDWLCWSEERAAVTARESHPWVGFLQQYDHWGITGGALAPHRADYSELHGTKLQELVYVCDRDYPGESALQVVSKNYLEKMYGIMFDKQFPDNFDLADPLPPSFFKRTADGVIYRGPPIEDMLHAATWATDLVRTDKKGRPAAVLRTPFKEEWIHSITPEAYVHVRWPKTVYYGADEFNHHVAPFSNVRDVARLIQQDKATMVRQLTYTPAFPSGIHKGPPRAFNIFEKSPLDAKKGDAGPWVEFVEHLFPVEDDRTEVTRFCATLSEVPEIKILYGLLLCSESQGVGKTTLCTILSHLVGRHNTTYPSETEIVEGNFTDWKALCRLIVIGEIYAGHSFKAYNRLKEVITDKETRINRKFQPSYDTDNWAHVVACSNSMKALRIPDEDRRWLIPMVTEDIWTEKKWQALNDWLSLDGYAIIKWWLQHWLEDNASITPGARSPISVAKTRMMQEGMSPGMELIADRLKEWEEDFCGMRKNEDKSKEILEGKVIVTTDHYLQDIIKNELYDGRHTDILERPMTLARLAKGRGWHVGKERIFISAGSPNAKLICNRPGYVDKPLSTLDPDGNFRGNNTVTRGQPFVFYLTYANFPS